MDDIGEGDDCKVFCLGFCFLGKVLGLFFICCRWVFMMIEEEKKLIKKVKGIFVLIEGYNGL